MNQLSYISCGTRVHVGHAFRPAEANLQYVDRAEAKDLRLMLSSNSRSAGCVIILFIFICGTTKLDMQMLMKTAAARTSYPPPPTRAQVQTGFAAARAAILQAEARRMPILTSSKTGPIWTAPPGGADWEQSTITYAPEPMIHLTTTGSKGKLMAESQHVGAACPRRAWTSTAIRSRSRRHLVA